MIYKILSFLDNSSKGEVSAVIASLVDWKEAFSRQDPTLGIKSFIENKVRPSLIPMLINYFQGRKGFVKWKGLHSETKDIYGGGPQGGFFEILSYLSQSNDISDMVDPEENFKFVDDLSVLDLLNLLSIGMCCFNAKNSVPSDIPDHNGYISPENLKTQEYLNKIAEWTERKNVHKHRKV